MHRFIHITHANNTPVSLKGFSCQEACFCFYPPSPLVHLSTKKTHQGRLNLDAQPFLVEQQFLATVTNAEKLVKGNSLLLSSLYRLAIFYHDRKEYAKAISQYDQVLQLKENISGPKHPDILVTLQRYARVLEKA